MSGARELIAVVLIPHARPLNTADRFTRFKYLIRDMLSILFISFCCCFSIQLKDKLIVSVVSKGFIVSPSYASSIVLT